MRWVHVRLPGRWRVVVPAYRRLDRSTRSPRPDHNPCRSSHSRAASIGVRVTRGDLVGECVQFRGGQLARDEVESADLRLGERAGPEQRHQRSATVEVDRSGVRHRQPLGQRPVERDVHGVLVGRRCGGVEVVQQRHGLLGDEGQSVGVESGEVVGTRARIRVGAHRSPRPSEHTGVDLGENRAGRGIRLRGGTDDDGGRRCRLGVPIRSAQPERPAPRQSTPRPIHSDTDPRHRTSNIVPTDRVALHRPRVANRGTAHPHRARRRPRRAATR